MVQLDLEKVVTTIVMPMMLEEPGALRWTLWRPTPTPSMLLPTSAMPNPLLVFIPAVIEVVVASKSAKELVNSDLVNILIPLSHSPSRLASPLKLHSTPS
jgi:hypothetical protein